jgi:deoxyribodipyrimidine photo-lyase
MVGEDYSSKFSAWLALYFSRTIYDQVKKYEEMYGNDSTYGWF